MTDHIKTLRLYTALAQPDAGSRDAARAALDSLEAELATLRECHAANAQELHRADALIGELRARLAPADSPPGDEELAHAIESVRSYLDARLVDETAKGYARSVIRAAEAHLRSQQPESDDQRAERELLAALRIVFAWCREHEEATAPMPVFHEFMSHADGTISKCGQWRVAVPRDGKIAIEEFLDPEPALIALADALAKARDAEGGKS